MDEDTEEEDNENEDEDKDNEEDSDIPSDFEREMAVDSDSNNDDDSEDEEEEENADKLNKDIDQHKKELEELKERDPEFYEFLQKEDNGLLDFGESEDEEEQQEGGEEYSDMEEPEEEEQHQEQIPVLKKTELNGWIEAVKSNKDLKAFKKLLNAFKTAARMSEEDDKITFTIKIEDPTGNKWLNVAVSLY
jgi:nucleolar complex protein 2